MEAFKIVSEPITESDLKGFDTIGAMPFDLIHFEDIESYYSQFSVVVKRLVLKNSKNEVLGSAVLYTKEYYIEGRSARVLFIGDVSAKPVREALVGWSQAMLPEILNQKKALGAEYAFFMISSNKRKMFNFFIRPRKIRSDHPRFNLVRSVKINLIQGKTFFAEDPLEHLIIRRAVESDLDQISGYIKKTTANMPLARLCTKGFLSQEILSWKEFSPSDIFIALDCEGKIVGTLGSFPLYKYGKIKFDLKDSRFDSLQQGLRIGSYFKDLRPVLRKKETKINLFTHMYFNNHDIFYSLVRKWIDETRKQGDIFVYPHFKGALKSAPSDSLLTFSVNANLYLIQEPNEPPSSLLKTGLLSADLDIDLPFVV